MDDEKKIRASYIAIFIVLILLIVGIIIGMAFYNNSIEEFDIDKKIEEIELLNPNAELLDPFSSVYKNKDGKYVIEVYFINHEGKIEYYSKFIQDFGFVNENEGIFIGGK